MLKDKGCSDGRVSAFEVRRIGITSIARRACGGGLGILCTLALSASLATSTAQATLTHQFLGSFAAGTFSDPQAVAVDQASGDVYVYDEGAEEGTIYKFNATGEPVDFSALKTNAITHVGAQGLDEQELAVDSVNGDIYFANGKGVAIYEADGAPAETGGHPAELNGEVELAGGPWGEPCGVAVDSAGNVYVGLYPGDVNKYTPLVASAPVTNSDYVSSLVGVKEVCNIAADPAGDVYVDSWSTGPVTKYAASQFGTPSASGVVVDGTGSTLAVDPANNDLYVDEGSDIAQFNATGSLLGRSPVSGGEGAFSDSYGVAVSDLSGDVYVLDGVAERVDIFGPSVVLAEVTSAPASGLQATSATLNGTVNADGTSVTNCEFEWGSEEGVYPHTIPCSQATPFSGEDAVAVSAQLSGLQQGATYHYRLAVTNQNGTAHSEDETFFTPFPVNVLEESVSGVTSTSATLSAQLNPGGGRTSYRFEYGTSTAYGSSAPAPEGQAGAGTSETTVSHELQGLSPGTTYHFRLAATNPLGTVFGVDKVFTTQPAGGEFGLPDNRQYELVSPPQKDGAEVDGYDRYDGYGGVVQAAENGGGITYLTSGPAGAGAQGNTSGTQVISTRSIAGGWSSRDITTPHTKPALEQVGHGEEYKLFSPDLSSGLVRPEGTTPLSPQAAPEKQNIYRWSAEDGSYEPLITSLPLKKSEQLQIVGASPDLSHAAFVSYQALTANALNAHNAREPNLYYWTQGKLQLVNVLPEGPPTNGAVTDGEAGLGGYESRNARHAVSNDGSRVIWTDNASEESEGNADIYIRETNIGKTVLAGKGEFQIASSDGSRVFFLQRERIGEEDESRLFEFDLNSGERTQLTPGNAQVQGVVGASEDGSVLYFVAHAVLKQGATNGANNLYMLRDNGGSWTPAFIATLASGDVPDWGGRDPDLGEVTSQVSPDGSYLAFMSSASPTGYDNHDANSGQPDVEVYLYDSGSGHLACVSCNPTGAQPVGEADYNQEDKEPIPMDIQGAWEQQWLAGAIRGWTEEETHKALYQSRELSDSGRLFFDSSDALVPHDTNGREDVYEYEPEGTGTCELESGCVSLISAGTGSADSIFMDASVNGEDAFFITRDKLVGEDFDDSFDMYDAHVCSASEPCPAVAPVAPPPCTTGDSCKPSPSPQPAIFGSPASATFSGAGNLAPPAPSAKVKKHKPKHKHKKSERHKRKRARRGKTAKKPSGGAKR